MTPRRSRFGIDVSQFDDALEIARGLDLVGLSFHIDTIEMKEKAIAATELLKLYFKAMQAGFAPVAINIGGGFRANHLASKSEWLESISRLKGGGYTWNDYGYKTIQDFYVETAGADYLNAFLETKMADFGDRTIGEFLSENMIELYIEPGCSLVAGAGLTAAKVLFTKTSGGGDLLVGLDMKKSDISMGGDFLVDPIIASPRHDKTPCSFYMLGNLCMESDMISMRKIFSDITPVPGDIFIFANTAGYFMDFHATHSIMHDPAKKIAIFGGGKWRIDE
jgi:diaminopimelate decarboxylase